MKRACLDCGRPSLSARCQHCAKPTMPGAWSNGRNRATQRAFRNIVLANAGHQCQATTGGVRCPEVAGLQAHHIQPGVDDPSTGLALCHQHHKLLDPHAR